MSHKEECLKCKPCHEHAKEQDEKKERVVVAEGIAVGRISPGDRVTIEVDVDKKRVYMKKEELSLPIRPQQSE